MLNFFGEVIGGVMPYAKYYAHKSFFPSTLVTKVVLGTPIYGNSYCKIRKLFYRIGYDGIYIENKPT